MVALVTPRLLLRQWHPDDVVPYAEICNDPRVMAHIGDGSTRSLAQTEASIERMVAAWDETGFGIFALERLDNNKLIGFCGLASPEFLPEILPAVEVGWRLAHDEWGKGFAAEAAQAVVDWAFDGLVLHRLVAVIAVDNKRSRELAERLGMKRERRTVIPKNGIWADVYEVTESKWASPEA